MYNALSFDVEDYFQVSAFCKQVEEKTWENLPSRVQANTEKVLEILDENDCFATFFVLGWIAERFPGLVRQISDRGHEIACHSYAHRRIFELTPLEFRADSLRAKCCLEEITGKQVIGYRAPSFSVTPESLWALEILCEIGYTYDSSIFPVDHPNYGISSVPRVPFLVQTQAGPLIEFPMPSLAWGKFRSPLGGGAYLRLLPYWYTRWAIQYLNDQENVTACVYLHPWELDAGQPRIKGSPTSRLRHYWGLGRTTVKLHRLLKDFHLCPLNRLIPDRAQLESGIDMRSCRLQRSEVDEVGAEAL